MDFVANQAGVFQRHAPLRAPRGPGAVALGEGRTRGGVEGGWGVCMAWIEGGLIWRCFVFVLCCFVFLLMFFFFFFFFFSRGFHGYWMSRKSQVDGNKGV